MGFFKLWLELDNGFRLRYNDTKTAFGLGRFLLTESESINFLVLSS